MSVPFLEHQVGLVLAHEGHSHGPDLGLVALLIAVVVAGILLLGTVLVEQRRARRSGRRTDQAGG
jgi:hypothetical protein